MFIQSKKITSMSEERESDQAQLVPHDTQNEVFLFSYEFKP